MAVVVPLALWLASGEARAGEEADTIEVRGVGMSCPSAAEVSQRLTSLLPAGARFETSDRIELREVPAHRAGLLDVEVRMVRAGLEAPLGVRRIERAGSCAGMADAIAVVVASWKAEFALPEPTVPLLPAADATTARASSSPPPLKGAAAATLVAGPKQAPTKVPPVGVGALGGIVAGADGGLAPVVAVEGELRRGRLIGRLQVGATGERDVSLAGGRAEWRRVLVGLSAGAALWRTQHTFADVTLEPVAGVTWARGVDFPVRTQATGLDLGLAPAIRLGYSLSRLSAAVWVAVGSVLWLRSHVLIIDGATETRALPKIDGQVSVGVTFSFRG